MKRRDRMRCDWCGKGFGEVFDIRVGGKDWINSFNLIFAHGQAVPHFPWTYCEVNLCPVCIKKLWNYLKKEGVKLNFIRGQLETSAVYKNENGKLIKIS